jgi:hypothetical protein
VLFALVLFLVAVSQRFRILGVRIGAIALAVGLLGYALYEVATLPRFSAPERRFSSSAAQCGLHPAGCQHDAAGVLHRRQQAVGGSSTRTCRTTPRAVQSGRYLAVGAPSSPDAWLLSARAFSRRAAS